MYPSKYALCVYAPLQRLCKLLNFVLINSPPLSSLLELAKAAMHFFCLFVCGAQSGIKTSSLY